MSDLKADAARLKEEGNALHVRKEFQGAAKKYSEAIVKDEQNAVLWANRSASYIALKRYGSYILHTNLADRKMLSIRFDEAVSDAKRVSTEHPMPL